VAKLDKLTEQAKAHLEPGEEIRGAVQGTYETKIMGSDIVRTGSLIATDRRLVFYAKKLGGYELESFPYGNISSFEQGKNMMGHNVTFFASGNKVHMKWIKTDKELARFTELVKAAMSTADAPAAPSRSAPAQPDVMEQLRKLGDLRTAGVLTEEEFAVKKADLLSRL
jgi:Bacterial PH domain/Short C-terminal domain